MKAKSCLVLLGVLFSKCIKIDADAEDPRILIFGGNGFLGSETVSYLLDQGYTKITTVNRGGKYWDSAERIFPKVKNIKCDREKNLGEDCPELVEEVENNSYEFVIDFTAFKQKQIKDTLDILKDKVGVYILISTDQIYDVCNISRHSLVEEREATRPSDAGDVAQLNSIFHRSNQRFKVEEELEKRNQDGGPDYVILRLADAFGPRDTSYRWWIYQVWARLSQKLQEHPIHIPAFLEAYDISFVYSKDVAKTIVKLFTIAKNDDVINQAFNLGWSKPLRMMELLEEMLVQLSLEDLNVAIVDSLGHQNHFYTYPSTRAGAMNITKATKVLDFEPTDWREAVRETVEFFENAMSGEEFLSQRNEIVQVVGSSLYDGNLPKYYEALEEVYNIDLSHFTHVKDEL